MYLKYNLPLDSNIRGDIILPSSKSISHRLLFLQKLVHTPLHIDSLSKANDTIVFEKILKLFPEENNFDCEDAGTVFRFMALLCASIPYKEFYLTGTESLLTRPHEALLDVLKQLNATCFFTENKKQLYIKTGIIDKNEYWVDCKKSSQTLSALCLLASSFTKSSVIHFSHKPVSFAYVKLTLHIMQELGIKHELYQDKIVVFPFDAHKIENYVVESDWSSASFFYALAILKNDVAIRIKNLNVSSIQADAQIQHVANYFGINTKSLGRDIEISKNKEIDISAKTFNFNNMPDAAVPLILACAIKYPQISWAGLGHLIYKESNRIVALQKELKKIGIEIVVENDIIKIKEHKMHYQKEIMFHSHQDHRIVMSVSLLAFYFGYVQMDETDCVNKSFPDFFEQIIHLNLNKN